MEVEKCEECEQNSVYCLCEACQEHMCALCDAAIHRNGKRRSHFRSLLCRNCRQQSTFFCEPCRIGLCYSCSSTHLTHTLCPVSQKYSAIVFWDLENISPNYYDVVSGYQKLKGLYPGLAKMKVFTTRLDSVDELKSVPDTEVIYMEDENDLKIIAIDLSLEYSYYGLFVLISTRFVCFKQYLGQIVRNARVDKIRVGCTIESIEEMEKREIAILELNNRVNFEENLSSCCDFLLIQLKKLAGEGLILHELTEFVQTSADLLKTSKETIHEALKLLMNYKLLVVIERKFTSAAAITTVSLKLNTINLNVLLWTIYSLKLDQMLPTERAIQARIKEAFDYKITTDEWKELIDHIHKVQKPFSSYSNSSSSHFSLFSQDPAEDIVQIIRVKTFKDKVFNTDTLLLYPFEEKWFAYDKYLKCGDVLNIKKSEDWDSFAAFFQQYFSQENYEEKAIPGGRYGCGQFLKRFGSEALRVLSLGKLNYIVQLAIDEDLLRYQKNMLVWTACLKPPKENEANFKLGTVKGCIQSLLSSFKEGISLAQLPGLLNKQIDFQLDLQELGFAKLKDLLISIAGVQIVKKANKHQYAVFSKMVKEVCY
jgi:hypothetical protein